MSRGGFQLVTADNTLQVTSLGLSPVIEVETCIDDNTCLQNVWAQHTCTSHAWTAAHCGAWGGHIGRCCPVTCNSCPPKENRFETNAGTGGWGGTCTCPDGQQYEVGDEMNGCGSLACTGGTSGTCTRAGGAWSRNTVTCGPAPTPAPVSAEPIPSRLCAALPQRIDSATKNSATGEWYVVSGHQFWRVLGGLQEGCTVDPPQMLASSLRGLEGEFCMSTLLTCFNSLCCSH